MLSFTMLNVIMLSDVMLNVAAPENVVYTVSIHRTLLHRTHTSLQRTALKGQTGQKRQNNEGLGIINGTTHVGSNLIVDQK